MEHTTGHGHLLINLTNADDEKESLRTDHTYLRDRLALIQQHLVELSSIVEEAWLRTRT